MCTGQMILVVDDEEDIVCGLTLRLHAAGYQTIKANNGTDALNCVGQTRPDAILLDVRMPGMDGLTMLKRLQACDSTRELPVVMLSASLCDQRHASRGRTFFSLQTLSWIRIAGSRAAGYGVSQARPSRQTASGRRGELTCPGNPTQH